MSLQWQSSMGFFVLVTIVVYSPLAVRQSSAITSSFCEAKVSSRARVVVCARRLPVHIHIIRSRAALAEALPTRNKPICIQSKNCLERNHKYKSLAEECLFGRQEACGGTTPYDCGPSSDTHCCGLLCQSECRVCCSEWTIGSLGSLLPPSPPRYLMPEDITCERLGSDASLYPMCAKQAVCSHLSSAVIAS
eukprot:scaffold458471_cov15-Prasinocladus_malaysianus.AAC.1